jgi:hypothetical protein
LILPRTKSSAVTYGDNPDNNGSTHPREDI